MPEQTTTPTTTTTVPSSTTVGDLEGRIEAIAKRWKAMSYIEKRLLNLYDLNVAEKFLNRVFDDLESELAVINTGIEQIKASLNVINART